MQAITPSAITAAVAALADVERARGQARFFKTGPGQYGAGDQFIGVTVPQLRQLARGLRGAPLDTLEALLRRPVHEERLLALLILVEQYRRGDAATRQAIYELYRRSMATINNWDLIDASAADIVGAHLDQRADRRAVLESLARSPSLWERRLAMISTYHQIKQGRSEDALHVAGLLLADREDLIHKAVGWMLREVGKRCAAGALEAFLRARYHDLPRTTLRYAIERFSPEQRQRYLQGPPPPR